MAQHKNRMTCGKCHYMEKLWYRSLRLLTFLTESIYLLLSSG
jgi:hypothetical protein